MIKIKFVYFLSDQHVAYINTRTMLHNRCHKSGS